MKLYPFSILVILFIFFIGCDGGGSSSYTIEEENITTIEEYPPPLPLEDIDENFTIINSGYININYKTNKKFQVITTSEDFNETYKVIDSKNIPQIDFDKGRVLAFIGGDKPSSEYSTKVDKITTIRDRAFYSIVSLETTIEKEECIKNKTLLLPFTFIYITTPSEVLFSENIKVKDCNKTNLNETPQIVSFREIDIGSNGGDNEINKRIEVVQTSQEYKYLYYYHVKPITFDKELPYVDFAEETLLAIFIGKKGLFGYEVKVTSIKEYNDYVEVEIKNTIVGDGHVLPLGTSPVTFVAIPKTNKEIVFKEYPTIINH